MSEYAFQNASILVVDDSGWMRVILRQMLKALRFVHIHEANGGTAALKVAANLMPDIILTDWDMPVMNGLELSRRLRRLPGPTCYAPIIMISAYGTLSAVLAARNAGVTEFLVKPVSPQTLYAHLVTVVERPRPFVEAGNFIGPDRRRRELDDYKGPRRRANEPRAGEDEAGAGAGAGAGADPTLSQDEISYIMRVDQARTEAVP